MSPRSTARLYRGRKRTAVHLQVIHLAAVGYGTFQIDRILVDAVVKYSSGNPSRITQQGGRNIASMQLRMTAYSVDLLHFAELVSHHNAHLI